MLWFGLKSNYNLLVISKNGSQAENVGFVHVQQLPSLYWVESASEPLLWTGTTCTCK